MYPGAAQTLSVVVSGLVPAGLPANQWPAFLRTFCAMTTACQPGSAQAQARAAVLFQRCINGQELEQCESGLRCASCLPVPTQVPP